MAIIGFIGLGVMGRPMAKNLINAGYKLIVYDKSLKYNDLQSLGAEGAVSGKDVASKSEIIITMLPNAAQVKEALLGAGGVIDGLNKGNIVTDLSSMPQEICTEVNTAINGKNAFFIDAFVSGGESKAAIAEGKLTIIAGGDKSAFDKVKPILQRMASNVILAGGSGAGNAVKLANQIIVAVNLAAVCEAFVLAAKAGVNPRVLLDAIKDGLAGSNVMKAKVPEILNGNFKPGLPIELHEKDLEDALGAAEKLEVPLPLTGAVSGIFKSLIADGMAANDHGAIARFYEKLADIEIRK